jgi:hypothetical protein
MSFKCNLNLDMSIIFEMWVVVIDTPAILTPHECTLVSVEEWLDLLAHFYSSSPVVTGWM